MDQLAIAIMIAAVDADQTNADWNYKYGFEKFETTSNDEYEVAWQSLFAVGVELSHAGRFCNFIDEHGEAQGIHLGGTW